MLASRRDAGRRAAADGFLGGLVPATSREHAHSPALGLSSRSLWARINRYLSALQVRSGTHAAHPPVGHWDLWAGSLGPGYPGIPAAVGLKRRSRATRRMVPPSIRPNSPFPTSHSPARSLAPLTSSGVSRPSRAGVAGDVGPAGLQGRGRGGDCGARALSGVPPPRKIVWTPHF